MSRTDMAVRANLQPHLVNLIAGLRLHQVEEAVALLLDYIDAGQQQTCRPSHKVQDLQEPPASFKDFAAREMPWLLDGDLDDTARLMLTTALIAFQRGRESLRSEAAQLCLTSALGFANPTGAFTALSMAIARIKP